MSFEPLQYFQREWNAARKLSLELLESLNEEDLQFSPGAELGPFWKQFRHLGRVQQCYIEALSSGEMKFTPEHGVYDQGETKEALASYLRTLDERLIESVAASPKQIIRWPDEHVPVFEHLMRLVSHEVLHQGQWVVYMSLLNRGFPKCWEVWGL